MAHFKPRPDGPPRLRVEGLVSPHGGPYSLAVDHGECVAVIGRSGSGKSVLLRLIADLDPHEGEVLLDGRARSSWPAPHWRGQVVYQPAEPAWWATTARAHFGRATASAIDPLMEGLGLGAELLDADITRLSTGERQRMALVRSLACEPQVLLLDEPTAALDHASTLALEALLADRVRAGLSVVLVTHSREQAERAGHRLLEVRERQVHAA
jgi:ABC-type iron transport system FetAB ATPase subunit